MRSSQGGGSSGPMPSAVRMSSDSFPGLRSANSPLLVSAGSKKYLRGYSFVTAGHRQNQEAFTRQQVTGLHWQSRCTCATKAVQGSGAAVLGAPNSVRRRMRPVESLAPAARPHLCTDCPVPLSRIAPRTHLPDGPLTRVPYFTPCKPSRSVRAPARKQAYPSCCARSPG